MAYLEYCSYCGSKINMDLLMEIIGIIAYHAIRFIMKILNHSNYNMYKMMSFYCKASICPAKGEWGLPGGFMELNETLMKQLCESLKKKQI